jgi:hypothetical protein
MKLSFCNKGILSSLDLTSMGDSSKREDENKIGRFDSGLKYAICILYKHGVDIKIKSGNFKYSFSSSTISCETGKSKKILVVNKEDLITGDIESFNTGFSIKLGQDWELWMAIRELYSNMLDEKGTMYIDTEDGILIPQNDTVIIIESPLLNPIVKEWGKYFLDSRPINKDDSKTKVHFNAFEDQLLRIYKQGILIYTDDSKKSKFVYDSEYATIDEMRMLNNYSDVRYYLVTNISKSEDEDLIKEFIKIEDKEKEYFESGLDFGYFSSKWVEIINELQPQYLIEELRKSVLRDNRCTLESKIIKDGRSWYSSEIEVKILKEDSSKPIEDNTPIPIVDQIISECKRIKFKIEFPLKESIIKGRKAIASTYDKIIFIDSSFTVEHDMWEFIKQHYVLKSTDENLIFKDYYKLINKK